MVILLNYYSVALSEYVSSTALGSAAALFVLFLALGLLVRCLTGNEALGWGVCLILMAAVTAAYLFSPASFEELLPEIMAALSLFDRFSAFVNGVFDLTAIVYYASVIIFFLFLTVQSLEKRRYA